MQYENKLKLTLARIVAYVVIVLLSAASFVGLTYLTGGNFMYALIGALLTALLLFVYFILPSMLQASTNKSSWKTVLQRILIYTSPVMFCVLAVPASHFANLYAQKGDIESLCKASVKSTRGLFKSYEDMAEQRIINYKESLKRLNLPDAVYQSNLDEIRTQLFPSSYKQLKSSAEKWLSSVENASMMNILVYGNLTQFEDQINDWNKKLNSYTKVTRPYEENVQPFEMLHPKSKKVLASLNKMRAIYFDVQMPRVLIILIGVLMYLLLIMSYIMKALSNRSNVIHSGIDGLGGVDDGLDLTNDETIYADDSETNYPTFTL